MNSFPIKILKKNNALFFDNVYIQDGAINNYNSNEFEINEVTIIGEANFNEGSPYIHNNNLIIESTELYIFQDKNVINSDIIIRNNGILRIINNDD